MKIGYLRDYLRNKLRANRLSTDWKEGSRVNAANQRVKPDAIPEHNDPYRIDWTEVEGKHYFVGNDVRSSHSHVTDILLTRVRL
jgi:actin-related protein 8